MGYQHDYTDCTELLLSHTEGTESTDFHCFIYQHDDTDSNRAIRYLCMPLYRKLQIHLQLSIELHTDDKCLGNFVAGI